MIGGRTANAAAYSSAPPSWIVAIIVIFAVLGALWPRAKTQPLNVFDQAFYIGIAHDLRLSGTFTNGFTYQPNAHRPAGETPGMRFTPLYPALVAVGRRRDRPRASTAP